MQTLFPIVASLLLATVAMGQTGRRMVLRTPAVVGQTASFEMRYPSSETGNFYAFLWSSPPFSGTTQVTAPGMTVQGLVRVDPLVFLQAYSGLLGPSGSVVHNLAVPNDPAYLGLQWDLQGCDLSLSMQTLAFADNDLNPSVSPLAPTPDLVPIAPGSFWMGSTAGNFNEVPVHLVTITRPFWISKYEVKQSQYQAVMGNNPSQFRGPEMPVESVLWDEARSYCAALTVLEAAAGRLPAGYVYRLPTEAEWEYCCRAGTTTEWNIGSSLNCGQANCIQCIGQPSDVGGYVANAWGLHDMHGNVAEWCLDGWDFSANYPAGPVSDPYVVTLGLNRIHRGGTFNIPFTWCRSAWRGGDMPIYRHGYLGFRVVLAQ